MSVQFTVTAQADLHQLQTFLEGKGKNTRVYGKEDQGVVTLYLKPEATTTAGKIKDKIKRVFSGLIGTGHKRREAARKGINQLLQKVRNQPHVLATDAREVIDVLKDSYLQGHNMESNKASRAGELSRHLKLINDMVEKSRPPVIIDVEQKLKEAGLGIETETSFLEGDTIESKSKDQIIQVKAGPIELQGQRFYPKEHLASGSFGHVFRYESEKGESIAFKIGAVYEQKELQQKSLLGIAKEVKAHRELSEKVSDGIVKFRGALRFQGGIIGVAMDYAPLGNMSQMAAKIRNKIVATGQERQEGQLTAREGRALLLTLIKDMARGLMSMHDKANVSHIDFKSENVLINGQGEGVIADFGTLSGGQDVELGEADQVDLPFYKAPEYSYIGKLADRVKDVALDVVKEDKKQLFTHLRKLLTSEDSLIESTVEDIYRNRLEIALKEKDGQVADFTKNNLVFNDPKKIDIWGFGASTLELLSGHAIMMNERGNLQKHPQLKEHRLRAFYTEGRNENAVQPRDNNGNLSGKSVAGSTGDQAVDDFLNWVLKSDPKDRPTAQQILEHPLLNAKGVGSIEAYDLIKSLGMEGDTTELVEAARTNFLDEIGTDDN